MTSDHPVWQKLIDLDELNYLFTDFCDMTGLPVALLDVATGQCLQAVGFSRLCADFHRSHPVSLRRCQSSDASLVAELTEPGKIRVKSCENGLLSACTPIFVQNRHLLTLASGQVFFASPDLEYFRQQAEDLEFDPGLYLDALDRIPIIEEKRLQTLLRYLAKKITYIAEKNYSLNKTHTKFLAQEQLVENFGELVPMAIGVSRDGRIQWANAVLSELTGYRSAELIDMRIAAFYPSPEAFQAARDEADQQLCKRGTVVQYVRWQTRDHAALDILFSMRPLLGETGEPGAGDTVFTATDISGQLRQESQLRENRERLSLATTSAGLGLWDWKIQTGELYFNDIYLTMLGFSADAFPQKFSTWEELLHPEDRERLLYRFWEGLESSPHSWSEEFRLRAVDGDYRWILGQGKIVEFSPDGIPLRAAGIHQDISERKHNEARLVESWQRYKLLFDNMSSPVIIADVVDEGRGFLLNDFNNAASRLLGFSPAEVVGRHVQDVFPGIVKIGLPDMLREVYHSGVPRFLPGINYRDEQLDLWGDLYLFGLSRNKVAGVFNDRTQQKNSAQKLEQQRRQLEQVIDLAPDAFLFGCSEGVIAMVNRQATELTGYSAGELVGKNVMMLFSAEEQRRVPFDWGSLRKGKVLRKERKLRRKDGTDVAVEMLSKVMPNGTAQTFLRDITERRDAQEALLQSKEELEETNTALRVLIKKYEQEKEELEGNILSNILCLVEPHLDKLKKADLGKQQLNTVLMIERTLKDIVSPFAKNSILMNLKLSPVELQVANLIKQGKKTKQVADILNISPQTVDKHRSHIRKKLGIVNQDTNLRDALNSES